MKKKKSSLVRLARAQLQVGKGKTTKHVEGLRQRQRHEQWQRGEQVVNATRTHKREDRQRKLRRSALVVLQHFERMVQGVRV